MELSSRIFVAGHNGLVGSAIVRKLKEIGYTNIITVDKSEVDLMDRQQVAWFMSSYKPEYVFLAAAKVGGIIANDTYPAEFIYNNLEIQNNVIHQSYLHGVKKLLFLGSNCIYPKFSDQPIKEEYLLTGPLEPTNDAYAIAKIAGIKMCQSYRKQYAFNAISVMPANLYGPNDNFDKNTSHVFAALVKKFVDAKKNNLKTVQLFGDGSPKREFLHSNDLADACIFLMNNYDEDIPLNVSSGQEYSIKSLAELISNLVGYSGEIIWDKTQPNGTPRKKLDITKLNDLGWTSKINITDGILSAVKYYEEMF